MVEYCRKRYPQATVFGVTRHTSSRPYTMIESAIHLLTADITQPNAVQQVVEQAQPDLIIHLAAQASVAASWKNPLETLKTNAEGTVHLLEAVRKEHLTPRVVLVGSGEQYGMVRPEDNPIREEYPFRPGNPYAVSKATQDLYGFLYFTAYGLPIIRARPFNHFGPRQPPTFAVASFVRQIALIEAGKAQPILSVGNLQARRDFLPVEDVVEAYLALAEQGQPGEAYNIGSGQARPLRAVLDLLQTFTTTLIEVYEDPALLRPVDVPLLEADTSRLRSHTDWQPKVPFEVALQRTLDYWRMVVSNE